MNVFRICRDHPELLAYAIALTPYSREEYRQAQVEEIPDDFCDLSHFGSDIELARQHVLNGWESFSCRNGAGWGIVKQTDTFLASGGITTSGSPEGWEKIPGRVLSASAHLESSPEISVSAQESIKVEAARAYLTDSFQSFNRLGGSSWGFQKVQKKSDGSVRQKGDSSDTWESLPERLLSAVRALKPCYLENDGAIACIERWAGARSCFYLDPPYVGTEGYYACGNNKQGQEEEFHRQLAEIAGTVEAACVAVSYYEHPLVSELYPESSWHWHRKETVASSAGCTKNSKSKKHPKRVEILLVRKAQKESAGVSPHIDSLQLSLFDSV